MPGRGAARHRAFASWTLPAVLSDPPNWGHHLTKLEQQVAREDDRESSLRLGLGSNARLSFGSLPVICNRGPKGEGGKGRCLPGTACDFPWRAVWEEKVCFTCAGLRGAESDSGN